MSGFNPLNILIVQEEAHKYADQIKNRFPEKVASGEIRLLLAYNEVSLPDGAMDAHIIGTWPLIVEIPQMKNLQWLMTYSSGVDHWEKAGLLPADVPLVHLPGGSGIPIAEFTLGLMLNATKKYTQMWDNQKEKKFERIQGQELYGKTLGIIGLGGIGREIAKRAKAFGMNVVGTDIMIMDIPFVDKMYLSSQFEEVLKISDFVVLSCPETKETLGMMNEERFKLMKPTAYFINCARGSLVIKEDLIKALSEGWIAGAANDTHWIKKPLPSFLPSDDELWEAKNIFISPHISSWTDMYAERFGSIFVENIDRFIKGEPLISVAPGFATQYKGLK
ncbi:MAG: D-2-hydroxyacid dehydrogenase [Desulfotomaculaceae bacterium]|nr:D-2-hydroxyacid dehydrogenase [Desulfotomaculaceae bacterium]